MTTQELHTRQGWTLEQKIDHSVGAIEAFITRTGKVPYISFSGGKDSTVLLDLARRFVDRDIKGVFCNTGNEWPEIVRFVKQTENITIIRPEMTVKAVLEQYGFPLISKEQAHGIRQAKTTKSPRLLSIRLHGSDPRKGHTTGKISNCWQFLITEPFMVSEKCCDCLKKRPFARHQKETGEVPVIGTLAGESDARKREYIRRGGCNSFEGNHTASYPISIWTDSDIWEYLRKFRVPYSPIYDISGVERTGCMVCGFGAHIERGLSRFQLLNDLYPKAYRLFMNYTNNGVTYREALRRIGVELPDEQRQLKLF
jgi:3'-phosphoadenosine 5'-phosphosulfate sulfotransferase (PAPS reductase)/FAD synthetase